MIRKTNKRYASNALAGWRHAIPGKRMPLVIVLLCVALGASAQLQRSSAPRAPHAPAIKTTPGGRIQSVNPLSLPFWDDFSFTPVDDPGNSASNYPLDSLWAGSQSVWINNGLGLLAPSINVATFDGLNAKGEPYSADAQTNGIRDTLMSQPIKMTEVPVGERNTVFLSFFYQWKGNGEPPDKNDYIQLSFLNKDSVWEEAMRIVPKASFQPDQFYDTIIQVAADKYYHDDFRFRFGNYGRKSGPFDTWNIDFVYMAKNRTLASGEAFPERAIASGSTPLFRGYYYAVPLEHFNKNKKTLSPTYFDVKNQNSIQVAIAVAFNTTTTFYNYIDGATSTYVDLFPFVQPVNGLGGIMDPFERSRAVNNHLPDTANVLQFNPAADSMKITLQYAVTGDATDMGAGAFLPTDFTANDTLSTSYHLSNYYAYDDGTAEYSAMLTTTSDRLAYAFDMLTDEPDTLVGFDIYFPPYGLTGSRIVDFYIYGDEDSIPSTPIYEILSRTVKNTGINKFQRIQIVESIVVPKRFYIGYASPSVKIGLDLSNDTGDRIFVNSTGTWVKNNFLAGSLMIRPVFGKGAAVDPGTGLPEELRLRPAYPNPNRGTFYTDSRNQIVQIVSLTGQAVAFETESLGDEQRVTLKTATPGMYILRMKKGETLATQKIIVF